MALVLAGMDLAAAVDGRRRYGGGPDEADCCGGRQAERSSSHTSSLSSMAMSPEGYSR
jgi:hypothetical protein